MIVLNYIPDKNHPITSISTSISEEEYNRLNSYPARAGSGLAPGFRSTYGVLSNSCIDFVAVALADAGLADRDFQGVPFAYPQDVANIQAFLIQLSRHRNQPIEIKNLPASIFYPNANGYTSETILPVNYILNKIKDSLESGDLLKKFPPFLKNPSMWLNFATGNWTGLLREMFFHQIDPLALDLNGNGIETLAANGHDGAMFDHERLGIRTATGWVPRQRRHFGVRPQRRRQN